MRILIIFLFFVFSEASLASDAIIVKATAELTSAQKFNITVTVEHADEGWEHYVNAWRVYSPEGVLLGKRVLHHPHIKEQPFTRSLRSLKVSREISKVRIVPVCSKTGESKQGYTIKLW